MVLDSVIEAFYQFQLMVREPGVRESDSPTARREDLIEVDFGITCSKNAAE